MSDLYQSLPFKMGLQIPPRVCPQRSCDIMLHLANALKIWDVENQISSSRALCPRGDLSQFLLRSYSFWACPFSSIGSNPVNNSSVHSSRNGVLLGRWRFLMSLAACSTSEDSTVAAGICHGAPGTTCVAGRVLLRIKWRTVVTLTPSRAAA